MPSDKPQDQLPLTDQDVEATEAAAPDEPQVEKNDDVLPLPERKALLDEFQQALMEAYPDYEFSKNVAQRVIGQMTGFTESFVNSFYYARKPKAGLDSMQRFVATLRETLAMLKENPPAIDSLFEAEAGEADDESVDDAQAQSGIDTLPVREVLALLAREQEIITELQGLVNAGQYDDGSMRTRQELLEELSALYDRIG